MLTSQPVATKLKLIGISDPCIAGVIMPGVALTRHLYKLHNNMGSWFLGSEDLLVSMSQTDPQVPS